MAPLLPQLDEFSSGLQTISKWQSACQNHITGRGLVVKSERVDSNGVESVSKTTNKSIHFGFPIFQKRKLEFVADIYGSGCLTGLYVQVNSVKKNLLIEELNTLND